MVLNPMMKSPAWLDLSGNAVKLLLHLMMLSEGNNGWGHKDQSGELYLSEREAALAIGVSRNTASRTFGELVEHGFLRAVRIGHFKVKLKIATVWRLTFQPYPRSHQAPTNEWRTWRPEQNLRAQKFNGSGAKTGPHSETPRPTGAKIGSVNFGNGGKAPSHTGSIIAPHLDIPCDDGAATRDCGWWGADASIRAHVSARLGIFAWIGKNQWPSQLTRQQSSGG